MKKSRIIFVLTGLLFQSCLKSNPNFVLHNRTNATLDSVSIGVSQRNPSILLGVKPNEKLKGEIIFDSLIKNDGDYFIEIYNEIELIQRKRFGYYTNGKSLDYSFHLSVFKDSISVSYH